MGENTTTIGLCILSIAVLTVATVGQAINVAQTGVSNPLSVSFDRGGSLVTWQDDFFNQSRIDPAFSQNILVNTTVGVVTMDGTYPAWIDPSFTRMKQITISNSGQETFHEYDVNLTLVYDSDMQPDFDDLRFTDTTGAQLPYYIVKKANGISVDILVKLPILAPGQTTIYMFYGNPSVSSHSDFASVFSWGDRTHPDVMVSFKLATEGAWDPDVEYGGNRFLITWEERAGPEDINVPLPHYERTVPGVIHGRSYNVTGGNPVPDNNSDIDVSDPVSIYHAENPMVAYGAGKFFVVWEQNPANQPLLRYESDIMGALVTPDGQVTMRFTICDATGGQYDPQVAYDEASNRFLVVWSDTRYGASDYDIRGRLYNSNGYPVGTDFPIAYETYYQGDPWISGDHQGNFFIVYEDGVDPQLGPFSLYAYRYDSNGNRLGSRITIATGSSNVDYIFPAVGYNSKTQEFFVAWNDGDVSVDPNIRDSYDGNIWGKILNRTGSVVKNNYIVESGSTFIRTDVVPYFGTMFFVSYDGTITANRDVYGRLISSNGTILTSRLELTDGSSLNVDWANLAVGAGRICATWEDERDQVSLYADVFEYVWRSAQTTGSLNITTAVGQENALITTGQLMSVPIQPEEFREWRQFAFVDTLPGSTAIAFDVMDQTGTILLRQNVQNGENLSGINESSIRLRARLSRSSAQYSPVLDEWNVTALVGRDIYPPSTTISLNPVMPDGNDSWYISPVTVRFNVTDVDSDPDNITTYYRINGYAAQVYHPQAPPVISSEGPDNTVEYWSNDSVNEEIHQYLSGIKIDLSPPMITVNEPSYIVSPGNATVNGSAVEYASGSGVKRVTITVNEETIFDSEYAGNQSVWFQWNFTADRGETYDIFVRVQDVAGNSVEDRRTVVCPDRGLYDLGYVYLFDNPKVGPVRLLTTLGLSIAVNYDTLYVVLPGVSKQVASVKFVATQVFLGNVFEFWDRNTTDGCTADLVVPYGIYSISAFTYDDAGQPLGEYPIIAKMMIVLLKG